MHPLHLVIDALQRELALAATAASSTSPGGQPGPFLDRTTLKLQICFDTRPAPDGKPTLVTLVPSASDLPTPLALHELTLEWRPRPSTSTPAASNGNDTKLAAALQAAHSLGTLAHNHAPSSLSDALLTAELSPVIGAPGFDSSARATVLREILEPLQTDHVLAILDSLTQESPSPVDPAFRSAQQRLRRILHIAEAGRINAAVTLRTLIQQHDLRPLLAGVLRVWKTQNHWLDTPPPTP